MLSNVWSPVPNCQILALIYGMEDFPALPSASRFDLAFYTQASLFLIEASLAFYWLSTLMSRAVLNGLIKVIFESNRWYATESLAQGRSVLDGW